MNRRLQNLHTLAELESDGNKIVYISELNAILIMRRGNTFTQYTIKDNYWTPITCRTV